MSKFNTQKTSITENLAGGYAYKENPKLELTSLVLTSMVQDKFYRSADDELQKLKELILCIPKEYSAKLAVYARTKAGLRSITHVIAAELSRLVKSEEWFKYFIYNVVYRPDDITEILAYYLAAYKKPIPNALKKGLALAFGKFDEYALAKYRSDGKEVSLIDAVNLVHPIPNEKNEKALKLLVQDKLTSFDTWEVEISKAGKDLEEKKTAWRKLVYDDKLGYFAMLRNLRNILEYAPNSVGEVCERLADEQRIKKSLVMPFRFQTAYEVLKSIPENREVLRALGKAMDISLSNVPRFEGDTVVVLDESGSMEEYFFKAGVFAGALVIANDADLITFADNARYQNTLAASILPFIDGIKYECGGTNFGSIFPALKKKYDRVVIISDMQGWQKMAQPSLREYKEKFGANPKIYSFDISGYGSLQFPEPSVYCFAGLSDKVFDVMKYCEEDKNAFIKEIEKIDYARKNKRSENFYC